MSLPMIAGFSTSHHSGSSHTLEQWTCHVGAQLKDRANGNSCRGSNRLLRTWFSPLQPEGHTLVLPAGMVAQSGHSCSTPSHPTIEPVVQWSLDGCPISGQGKSTAPIFTSPFPTRGHGHTWTSTASSSDAESSTARV